MRLLTWHANSAWLRPFFWDIKNSDVHRSSASSAFASFALTSPANLIEVLASTLERSPAPSWSKILVRENKTDAILSGLVQQIRYVLVEIILRLVDIYEAQPALM